jgi:hypothetical protein
MKVEVFTGSKVYDILVWVLAPHRLAGKCQHFLKIHSGFSKMVAFTKEFAWCQNIGEHLQNTITVFFSILLTYNYFHLRNIQIQI